MKTTTLLLLLTLSVSVQSRLISGTVNLTKDTTGINFVNDTIQLVTNDTCKYPDCRREYYCGDTSAPDFFFTPLILGRQAQVSQIRFNVGSTKPLFFHYSSKTVKNIFPIDLSNEYKFQKIDTIYDSINTCCLPFRLAPSSLHVLGKTRNSLFFLLEIETYYTVISFNPVNGEWWYDLKGVHVKWWLQTNGKLDFDELAKSNVKTKCFELKPLKKSAQNYLYTIRGQKISPDKIGTLSGTQLIIVNKRFTIINNIANTNIY